MSINTHPGLVVIFGSGETSPSGRKVFEHLLSKISAPPKLALLETPSGFEPNSDKVIGRVADFIRHHLQNYHPQINTIPARKRGTDFSPDDNAIVKPLLASDLIFMGPGSPTYAVRQLRDSLAWNYLLARHRIGASLVFASAAAVAISAYAMPVYEIFKVGEDLHWKSGLDFFGSFGLPLVFVPHWNNNEGGNDLDTSRCFLGKPRFIQLMELLPPDLTVIGIDEKTALIMDLAAGVCQVMGQGGVTLIHNVRRHRDLAPELDAFDLDKVAKIRQGHIHKFVSGDSFPLKDILLIEKPTAGEGLSPGVWESVLEVQAELDAKHKAKTNELDPPPEALVLLKERQQARAVKDWATADAIRKRIASLGWIVQDTTDGPQLVNE